MLTDPAAVAEVLGLRGTRAGASHLSVIASIEHGFRVTVLSRLAGSIAPGDATFIYRFVPKPTLARRKRANQRLTPQESDRVARIAKVWAHALKVWKGEDDARAFLFRRHMMLDNRRPIDVALATEVGADLVDQILGRLEYGSAA
jgi:putative toxin-antitoxin system antitoxin component (TIGR02293 family)